MGEILQREEDPVEEPGAQLTEPIVPLEGCEVTDPQQVAVLVKEGHEAVGQPLGR